MSVEMRNLLHNPRPSGTAAWLLHNEYSNQPASMTVTADALTLTGVDGSNNAYASCKPVVPAGEYVIACTVSGTSGYTPNLLIRVWDTTAKAYICTINADGQYPGRVKQSFTVAADTTLEVMVQAPNAAASLTYSHLLLTDASNLAHMQELGVTWWCGDGYDRNGGGRPSDALVGYPPCEHWMVVA
ncbi:hypothetical protein [Bifidobacterium animalis]|nr:hypothetical protein [Bifidobacterium animalis]